MRSDRRKSNFTGGMGKGLVDQAVFNISGGSLNAMTAGPVDGPAVILLHGFPEFWYGWRKQIAPLADAGFRVIVPDQRGYNRSSKPREIRAYAMDQLTADVIAIADQSGLARVHIAGHDWGAAVAWNCAIRHPDRVRRLAILNVPHPAAMLHYLKSSMRQMARSWYMLFFQLPFVPEYLFSATNFRRGVRALVNSSRPGTFTEPDLDRYRQTWAEPDALTGMINWYRAAFRYRPSRSVMGSRVVVPTRILWGMQDKFLVPELASESLKYCDAGELFRFPNATHWLQHEEANRVSELLVEHFRA